MSSRHYNTTTTTTTEQARAQCRAIILKLKLPSTGSAANEPERMVNDLQRRVNKRFDKLVQEFVIDENEQMNAALLEKLRKVRDRDTFLEAFLTHLYGKAVKEEENAVSPHVHNDEKLEIHAMVDKVYAGEENI